jgi:hypothetical protein
MPGASVRIIPTPAPYGTPPAERVDARNPLAPPTPAPIRAAGKAKASVPRSKRSIEMMKVESPPVSTRTAKLQGEEAFQRGKMAMQTRGVAAALADLRAAVKLCPEAIEFALVLKWAEYCEQPTETRRSLLKRLAADAVKKDPNLAFGYFTLAEVAIHEGVSPDVPTRLLKHALRLDPNMADAQRALRRLAAEAG